MYDLIGDIHGHANELMQLLESLGYRESQGVHRHPDRKIIFLGDFIDRGPKIREVLEIVRPMVENGNALAVMGNHELNALAYHSDDPSSPGEHLRRHSDKNTDQHSETLRQLTPAELCFYLEWFRTLPMWLELDGLRVVHACWDQQLIATIAAALEGHGGITPELLRSACRQGGNLFGPVESVLKGKEAVLPEGKYFDDKADVKRTDVRTRWYLPPAGQTYRDYALQSDEIDCDLALDENAVSAAVPYPSDAKPVFIGHYWLKAERPETLAHNVACVDYSVAKGGFLCAYRWDGEQKLNNEHFVGPSEAVGNSIFRSLTPGLDGLETLREEARWDAGRRRPNLSFLAYSIEDLLACVRHQHFPSLEETVRFAFVNEGPLACIVIEDRKATIYVHQVLNHPDTPAEVMRLICKHEFLHLQVPETFEDGSLVKHTREFWSAEKAICPERRAAWRWLQAELRECLRPRRDLERIDVRPFGEIPGSGLNHDRLGLSFSTTLESSVPWPADSTSSLSCQNTST